jgi:hypothetical protein
MNNQSITEGRHGIPRLDAQGRHVSPTELHGSLSVELLEQGNSVLAVLSVSHLQSSLVVMATPATTSGAPGENDPVDPPPPPPQPPPPPLPAPHLALLKHSPHPSKCLVHPISHRSPPPPLSQLFAEGQRISLLRACSIAPSDGASATSIDPDCSASPSEALCGNHAIQPAHEGCPLRTREAEVHLSGYSEI